MQETLVIPLYGCWLYSRRYPHLFQDKNAVGLMERIDYDFSESERWSAGLMQEFGAMETAMRQKDMAWEVRDYLLSHPNAAVVNLGCGYVPALSGENNVLTRADIIRKGTALVVFVIPGTEDMDEYRDYRFHIRQSCIGMLLGLPACLGVGALTVLL